MKLIKIENQAQAKQASLFLASTNAFEDSKDWNETERGHLAHTPFRTFEHHNYHCWMMLDEDKVIGFIDLRELDLKNGGFYTDWFAVHKDLRSQGIGSQMLKEVEDFAKSISARYILIETGDIDIYQRTRKFYEQRGYQQVGHLLEYYYKDWGMYIYQKLL